MTNLDTLREIVALLEAGFDNDPDAEAIGSAIEEIEALRSALAPFAEMAFSEPEFSDLMWSCNREHFRNAARVLSGDEK